MSMALFFYPFLRKFRLDLAKSFLLRLMTPYLPYYFECRKYLCLHIEGIRPLSGSNAILLFWYNTHFGVESELGALGGKTGPVYSKVIWNGMQGLEKFSSGQDTWQGEWTLDAQILRLVEFNCSHLGQLWGTVLPTAKMDANNISFGWVCPPCSLVFSTRTIVNKM